MKVIVDLGMDRKRAEIEVEKAYDAMCNSRRELVLAIRAAAQDGLIEHPLQDALLDNLRETTIYHSDLRRAVDAIVHEVVE